MKWFALLLASRLCLSRILMALPALLFLLHSHFYGLLDTLSSSFALHWFILTPPHLYISRLYFVCCLRSCGLLILVSGSLDAPTENPNGAAHYDWHLKCPLPSNPN